MQTDDEILAPLDPGPFAGGYPDLGVFCARGCLERPCVHTWSLLAGVNGWVSSERHSLPPVLHWIR